MLIGDRHGRDHDRRLDRRRAVGDARSASPPPSASTGGRQVGGALGVAVLAALLDDGGAGVGPYKDVYLFCTLATLAVAATALWLITKEHR